jgi:chromosome segregation ATPase
MTSNEQARIAPNEGGAVPAAMPEAGIAFDPKTGISEEEQREILAKINGIAEKNRRSLAEGAAGEAGKKRRFKAKKSGSLFPALVNAAALVLLGGGFLVLSSFQSKTDTRVREGAKVYNSAERALIEEIRKETASRIAAKESEINRIVSQLEGVDAELRELHSNNQDLTAEQRTAEQRLRILQDEYRSSLAALHDERSRIMEDSRAREANLRAQLAAVSDQSRSALEQRDAALNAARGELDRLTGEREKAAFIEAQLGGHFAALHEQLRNGRTDAADETLRTMRTFLATPAFQALPAMRSRKELYTQAIDSLETALAETRKNAAAPAPAETPDGGETEKALAELREKNTRLEETVAGLNRTIAASGSEGAGLARRLTELENSAAALRNINTLLETSAAEKERSIAALETEKNGLSQTLAARDSSIGELQSKNTALEAEIVNLNNQLAQIRQALQALSQ